MRLPARCSAWLAALALSACARGEATHVPAGVIADPAPPGALVGGIYTSRPDDPTCCWTARDANFGVRKSAPADDFALRIYLPELQTFRTAPQGLTVTLDGRYRFERCCFGPGLHTVLFRLPDELRARTGVVAVRVHARRAMVPARDGGGPDTRALAFVLLSAEFTSFLRGHF